MVKDNDSTSTSKFLQQFNAFWVILLLDFFVIGKRSVLRRRANELEPRIVERVLVFLPSHVLDDHIVVSSREIVLSYASDRVDIDLLVCTNTIHRWDRVSERSSGQRDIGRGHCREVLARGWGVLNAIVRNPLSLLLNIYLDQSSSHNDE